MICTEEDWRLYGLDKQTIAATDEHISVELGVSFGLDLVRFKNFCRTWTSVAFDAAEFPDFCHALSEILGLGQKSARKLVSKNDVHFGILHFSGRSTKHFTCMASEFWSAVVRSARKTLTHCNGSMDCLPPFVFALVVRLPRIWDTYRAHRNIEEALRRNLPCAVRFGPKIVPSMHIEVPSYSTPNSTLFFFTLMCLNLAGLKDELLVPLIQRIFMREDITLEVHHSFIELAEEMDEFLHHRDPGTLMHFQEIFEMASQMQMSFNMYELPQVLRPIHVEELDNDDVECHFPLKRSSLMTNVLESEEMRFTGCSELILRDQLSLAFYKGGMVIRGKRCVVDVALMRVLEYAMKSRANKDRTFFRFTSLFTSFILKALTFVDAYEERREAVRMRENHKPEDLEMMPSEKLLFESLGSCVNIASILVARGSIGHHSLRYSGILIKPYAAMEWVMLCRFLPWAIYHVLDEHKEDRFMRRANLENASLKMIPHLERMPTSVQDPKNTLRHWLINFVCYCIVISEPCGTTVTHRSLMPGIDSEDVLEFIELLDLFGEGLDVPHLRFALAEHNDMREKPFYLEDGALHADFLKFITILPSFEAGKVLSMLFCVRPGIFALTEPKSIPETSFTHGNLRRQPREGENSSFFDKLLALAFEQAASYHFAVPHEFFDLRVPQDPWNARCFIANTTFEFGKEFTFYQSSSPEKPGVTVLFSELADRVWCEMHGNITLVRDFSFGQNGE